MAWAGTKPPENALWCDGAAYAISDYPALFETIGHLYGGTDTIFCVPDLRGRVIVGAGEATPETSARELNESGGAEKVKLSQDEIPSHSHGISAPGTTEIPHPFLGYKQSVASTMGHSTITDSRGGDKSHENMPPYLVLNFVVFYE